MLDSTKSIITWSLSCNSRIFALRFVAPSVEVDVKAVPTMPRGRSSHEQPQWRQSLLAFIRS
eukprot:2607402-Rhodomonas_salina.1